MATVSLLRWNFLLLLLLLSVSRWVCYSSGAEVTTVDVHKAKSLLQSGHVYLDVRTEEEFKAAHPDAETIWKLRGQPEKETDDDVTKKKKIIYNIPYMFNTSQGPRFRFCLIHLMRCALEQYFSHENDVSSGRVKNPEFVAKVKEILKEDDRLVVGCQSGARSLSATADLLSAGFKQACNMGGGYQAWEKNGFQVKKQLKQEEL